MVPLFPWPVFLAYFVILGFTAVIFSGILLGLYLLAASFVETSFPLWSPPHWLSLRSLGRPRPGTPPVKPTVAIEPEASATGGDGAG